MFYRTLSLCLILGLTFSLTYKPVEARENSVFPFLIGPQSRIGMDFLNQIKEYGDLLRNGDNTFGFLDDPALTSVTREYGPSIITIRQFPFRSKLAVSNTKPWSSWWYPKKEDFLFNDSEDGSYSPLAKYDFLRKLRNKLAGKPTPQSAAEYERHHYNSNSLPWEGLCDAWALASLLHPEPKKPVAIKVGNYNIHFSVADLKALLLKTYEAIDDSSLKYYGQKFTGDYNGWIFPDIFPEQFHRFLEIQLFDKQRAFIMDHDPGVEVWNVPVFKANYLMEEVPNEPNSILVRAWVYSAESVQSNEKHFVGTREAIREYNYVLQGFRNGDGDLVVNSGYWIQRPDGTDSRKDHPDFLTVIAHPEKLVRKSWNPEIDVGLIDEILSQSF